MVENDDEDMDYVVDLKPKKNNKKGKTTTATQPKNVFLTKYIYVI
jgi:hypothetical protein